VLRWILSFLFLTHLGIAASTPNVSGSICSRKLEPLVQKYKLVMEKVDNNTIWLSGRKSIMNYSSNVKYSALTSTWYDFLAPSLKAVSPVPFFTYQKDLPLKLKTSDYMWRGPTQSIFDKLWKNSNYQLTSNEAGVLQRYQKLEKFFEVQKLYQANPRQVRVNKFVSGISYWAKFFSFIAGGVYLYQHVNEGGLVDIKTFLKKEEHKLKDNQVQILIDTVPFPHLGIRMGNVVYSYGQTHMTKRDMSIYFDDKTYAQLLEKEFPQEVKVQGSEPEEFDGAMDYSSFKINKSLGVLTNKVGLDSIPKTLSAITLNLQSDEYIKLRKYLEARRAHRYKNITAVNDCATMIVEALKETTSIKISKLVDASPGQVGYAFGVMKSLGDDRVGKIYQVSMDSKQNSKSLLIRNSYIHMIESKLFISYFLYNQAIRAYIDQYEGRENIVTLDKEIKDVWENQWKKELEDYYLNDPTITYLYDMAELLQDELSLDNEKLLKFSQVADSQFLKLNKKNTVSDLTDRYDEIKYSYKALELYKSCNKFSEYLKNSFNIELVGDFNCEKYK